MIHRPSKGTLAALARFAAGGVLSSAVTLGTTATLHEIFDVGEKAAAAVGLACALGVNFFFLRHVVFRGSHGSVALQLAKFLGSSGVFRLGEYLAFLVLDSLTDVHYLVGLVIVLGVSFLLKFVLYRTWVFARVT